MFLSFYSCNGQNKNNANESEPKTVSQHVQDGINSNYYDNMKKQVMAQPDSDFADSSNYFDENHYDPTDPKFSTPLIQKGRVYQFNDNIHVNFDSRSDEELKGAQPMDTLHIGKETFVRNLHELTEGELMILQHDMSFLKAVRADSVQDGSCSGKDCPVYAHVDKGDQRLYLFIQGEPVDTFKTSTARKGYTTPNFNKKPSGRMYEHYTSHKFPGGDWHGYGNMPFAVFVNGGYAIHGATSGEIRELGHPASHGCIRIHPRNAKIFYNVVKYAEPQNVWITITD